MNHSLSQNELECLRDLQRVASGQAVSIVAVGASARQLVFDTPYGIPVHRTTTDWDFGVRVANWEAFHHLRALFTKQGGTFKTGDSKQQLVHVKTGIKVDLVPFGGLENDGRIRWPDDGLEMTVLEFSNAYEHAVEVELGEAFRLKVATTPLLVALKVFAFSDRCATTDRDLRDLWHMMQNYLTPNQERRLLEEPLATLVGDDFDWGNFAGALLLGFDVGRACEPDSIRRMLDIVATLCDPYSRSINPLLRQAYSDEDENTQRQNISNSFDWFRRGLQLAMGQREKED